MRCKVPDYVSVGSGSLNAYAIMDARHKEEMTDEEAVKLGKDAIMHSTYRDAGSGGFNNSKHFTVQSCGEGLFFCGEFVQVSKAQQP